MSTDICNKKKKSNFLLFKKLTISCSCIHYCVYLRFFLVVVVVVNMLLSTQNELYERIELFTLFVLSIYLFLFLLRTWRTFSSVSKVPSILKMIHYYLFLHFYFRFRRILLLSKIKQIMYD